MVGVRCFLCRFGRVCVGFGFLGFTRGGFGRVGFLGGGCIGLGGLRGLYRIRAGLFWGSAAKWVGLAVPVLGLGFSILRGVVWFVVWFVLVCRHVVRPTASAIGSWLPMLINNDESSGRAIRAVLDSLRGELNPATVDRLSCFARGYLAHAENDENFETQSYYFDGFDILFSVASNGWVSVSAYPSSFETGTNWANEIKLFSVRGAQ